MLIVGDTEEEWSSTGSVKPFIPLQYIHIQVGWWNLVGGDTVREGIGVHQGHWEEL